MKLEKAASQGDLAGVQAALAEGANTSHLSSRALRLAAEGGHADCVKLLIPVSDPLARGSGALAMAAERGHIECVKLLIPVSDQRASGYRALKLATEFNRVECARLLAEAANPQDDQVEALLIAAEEGHLECLRLLMPLSNSLASRSRALRGAAESGHAHCVLELLPVSDLSSQGPDGLGAVESARRRGHGDVAHDAPTLMILASLLRLCKDSHKFRFISFAFFAKPAWLCIAGNERF